MRRLQHAWLACVWFCKHLESGSDALRVPLDEEYNAQWTRDDNTHSLSPELPQASVSLEVFRRTHGPLAGGGARLRTPSGAVTGVCFSLQELTEARVNICEVTRALHHFLGGLD